MPLYQQAALITGKGQVVMQTRSPAAVFGNQIGPLVDSQRTAKTQPTKLSLQSKNNAMKRVGIPMMASNLTPSVQ